MKTLSANADDYCFFDFETRALPGTLPPDDNVVTAGAYRYAKNSFPIILTYAIGDGPIQCHALDDGFQWRMDMPRELVEFWRRAKEGKAWFVAWNCAFDRLIWYEAFEHRPLTPEMTLDAMCQAMAANLPADLDSASRAVRGPEKAKGGKKLIQLFSPADGGTPQQYPEEWERFKAYAVQDTEALRDVWRKTRPLPPEEWHDYWVSERINERGIAVDIDFARKAYEVSERNIDRSNRELERITGIGGLRVTMPKMLAGWIYDSLDDVEAQMILVVEDEGGDEDEEKKEPGLNLRRTTVAALRGYLLGKESLSESERKVVEVLNLREYGAASSPVKFRKMADQADGGRLKGSYVLNGAGQTGRFSSRGIQIHNLPRDTLGDREEQAILDLMDLNGAAQTLDDYAAAYGPVGRTLVRLIRPALVAPEGKVLVWGDWSNIEARMNPWLAFSGSGNKKIEAFNETDRNPDGPDIYMHTAGRMLNIDPAQVSRAQRQSHGKVPELSLGFGGGKGALLRMADTYGVRVSDEQAQTMVRDWRDVNPWARRFWDTLWTAIQDAMEAHLVRFEAGRVSYMFVPDYLGGSLLCGLPCGRVLTYPQCSWEKVIKTDPETGEESERKQLGYRKGHGRSHLWYGKACENVVQASAGSLLRAKLATLGDRPLMPVVLHTHDDICCEVDEYRAEEVRSELQKLMTAPEPWSGGLPLAAKTTANFWFTKADD